jgi:hypothetical protein
MAALTGEVTTVAAAESEAGAGAALATRAAGVAAFGAAGRGVATGVMSTSCSTRVLNSLVTSFIRWVMSVESASASRLATSRKART